jgi:hypothetical protein
VRVEGGLVCWPAHVSAARPHTQQLTSCTGSQLSWHATMTGTCCGRVMSWHSCLVAAADAAAPAASAVYLPA